MNYSKLDESKIFEAKRAFDKIMDFGFGVEIKKGALKNYIPIPDLTAVVSQIRQNIDIHLDKTKYVKQLKVKFRHAFELIEDLREEKYNLENQLNELKKLPQDFHLILDYDENTSRFFFGDKYRQSAPFEHTFNLGQEFKELALSHYFYTKNIRPDADDLEAVNLLERYNMDFKILTEMLDNANELLILAETIQETLNNTRKLLTETSLKMNTLEENEESSILIEKTTHKLVLLHELGVIECLQKVRKEKNPNLSDSQFADLVGSILGLQGKQITTVRKGISGYGRGGQDDPKTDRAFRKVKSELIKFGIEIS